MSRKKLKKKSISQRIKISIEEEYNILVKQKITEQQIREHWDEWWPIYLIQKRQLSKDFLREMFSNPDKEYDKYISSFQHLDQKFIEQWKDRLDWGWLSLEQNLNEEFILKFSEKIDWKAIWKKKRKWSEQFWNYLKEKVKTEN